MADVRPEIKSADGCIFAADRFPAPNGELVNRFAFFGIGCENIGHMAPGNDQRVQRTDGKFIPDRKSNSVFGDDCQFRHTAKDAVFMRHSDLRQRLGPLMAALRCYRICNRADRCSTRMVWLLGVGARQRFQRRHRSDVVAGIDEMDFAGNACRQIRQEIERGRTDLIDGDRLA